MVLDIIIDSIQISPVLLLFKNFLISFEKSLLEALLYILCFFFKKLKSNFLGKFLVLTTKLVNLGCFSLLSNLCITNFLLSLLRCLKCFFIRRFLYLLCLCEYRIFILERNLSTTDLCMLFICKLGPIYLP